MSPWTPKQHRYFEGVSHGSIRPKKGLTISAAKRMASEGIKKGPKKKLR